MENEEIEAKEERRRVGELTGEGGVLGSERKLEAEVGGSTVSLRSTGLSPN